MTPKPVRRSLGGPERWAVAGLGLLVIVFVVTVLVIKRGPGLWADAEQARLCRMLIPALFPERDGIEVLASEPGSGGAVHIEFALTRNDPRAHLITCRFGGTGYSASKRDLVSVQIDGVGLGETAFWYLKTGWLETQDSIAADPGPPGGAQPWFETSRETAVALQHMIGGLPRTGILALLALATALIYGLIGRINLAFGEFAAFGGIAATLAVLLFSFLVTPAALPASLAAIAIVLATTALAGAAVGRTIIAPLSGSDGHRAERGVQPLIVAGVGLLVAVQEALRLAQGAGTIWLPPVSGEAMLIARAPGFDVTLHPRLLAMTLIDWVAVIGVLHLMRHSRFGRAWRASADDPIAASLSGIDARGLLVATSALATALAGLAGATIALNYGGMHFSGGTMLGLTGLIAAILGGIGSLGGAVIGAMLIAAAQVGWSALQPIAHWELASFTLLTLMLILKPGGFFGHADGAPRRV